MKMSELNTKISEKVKISKMSTTEFTQTALREYIAPQMFDGELAKSRIDRAARKLGWSNSRTLSAWNGCPKMRVWGDELAQIEQITGLSYAKQEHKEITQLIANADRLLDSTDPDFHSAFTNAFREFVRSVARSRNQR
jgi:hypothetical protein